VCARRVRQIALRDRASDRTPVDDHDVFVAQLPELGPSGRVAVELSQESARVLAKAIQAVLDAAPAGLE